MNRTEQIIARLFEIDREYDDLNAEQIQLEGELNDLINKPRLFGNTIRWAIQTWNNYFRK